MYLVKYFKDDFVTFVRNYEHKKYYEPVWLGAFVLASINTLVHDLYTKLANATKDKKIHSGQFQGTIASLTTIFKRVFSSNNILLIE